MSHSEIGDMRVVRARGSSALASPADALRAALSALVGDLVRQGAAPHDIARITFHAPNPEAWHMARREIDLAWREVLGGLRKPVFYRTAPGDLVLEAEADVAPARSAPPLWRGMNAPELARQYSPRQQVADMQDVFARWNEDGARFRSHCGGLDIAYGRSRDETLDFYPAARRDAPLWVFLHGGYWQACTKDQHGQFAEGMLAHGFAVANLDYGLAPETSLAEIVLQIRHGLQFLVKEADRLGFDPCRIHLAGHSAGAQLAAMAASDSAGPAIASALLLSGVFDLSPLAHMPMGRMIGLAAEKDVRALSPLFKAVPAARIGLALGALESDEFKRQSAEMATAWGAAAPLLVDNCNHFNLLEGLRTQGPLLDLALHTAVSSG